jgi:hypothetical protein
MCSSLLDLYSDYLISSFGQTSATGLSRTAKTGDGKKSLCVEDQTLFPSTPVGLWGVTTTSAGCYPFAARCVT